MTIDRGGLEYRIEVQDAFAANLSRFRTDVEAARSTWSDFKRELMGGARATASLRTTTRLASRSARELSTATEASVRASKGQQKAFDAQDAALKKLERRRRTAKTSIAEANILDRQRAVSVRKLADGLTQLERAEARAILLRRRQRQRILQVVDAEKIRLRQAREQEKRLRNEQREAERAARAQRKLASERERAAKAAEKERLRTDPDAIAARQIAQEDLRRKVAIARERQVLEREFDAALAQGTFRSTGAGRAADLAAFAEQQKRAAEATKKNRGEQDALGKAVKANQGVFSQFFFSFRRLFGILAIFTLARRGIQAITGAIRQAISFNSRLEDAVLGIQSILAATGAVADTQGRLVTGAEKFALANAEARRQVALLRKDGLKTAATFEELLDTFQVALAPGLRAGLTVGQVRGFAVRIAQAAAAIGLPQNQLAEEIRSILQGTIQARTTRIAVALGITNEDIRRAREAGELADFLLERFSAFQFAGEESLSNFSVIIANLKDATSQLLAAGGEGFFADLKEGLRGILDTIAEATADGVVINPTAIRLVEAFFSILRNALRVGRQIGQALTLSGAANTAEAVADAINAVVSILGSFAAGFAESFVTVLSTLGEIRDFAMGAAEALGLAGESVMFFSDLSKFLGRSLGFLLSIRAVLFLIRSPILLISSAAGLFQRALVAALLPMRALSVLLNVATAKAVLLASPFIAIVGLVGLIVAAFKSDFVRSIKIGDRTVGELADRIKIGLGLGLKIVAATFEAAWIKSSIAVRRAWNRVVEFVADGLLATAELALEAAEFLGIDVEDLLSSVREQRKKLATETDEQNRKLRAEATKRLKDLRTEITRETQLAAARAAAAKAAADAKPQRTLGEAFEEAINRGKAFLGSVLGDLQGNLDDSVDLVDTLVKEFRELPPTIGQTNASLEQQGTLLDSLTEKAKDAARELKIALDLQGITGAAREQGELLAQVQTDLEDAAREFNSQIRQAQGNLDGLEVRADRIQERIRETGILQKEDAEFLARNAQVLSSADQRREVVLRTLKTLNRELAAAEASRDTQAIDAARRRIAEFEEESRVLKNQASDAERALRERIKSLDLEQDQAQEVLDLVRDLVDIEAQRTLQSTLLRTSIQERGRVEDLINRRTLDQISLLILKEKERLREAQERLRTEIEAERIRSNAFSRTTDVTGEDLPGFQNRFTREAAEIQAQLVELESQNNALQRKLELQRASLELQLAETRAKEAAALAQIEELQLQVRSTTDEAARSALLTQINGKQNVLLASQTARALLEEELRSLTEEERLELEKASLAADGLRGRLAQVNAALQDPVSTGLTAGLEEFLAQASDTFGSFKNIAVSSLQGVQQFISGSLASAFNVDEEFDIVGRFQQLASDIVKVVIDEFTKLFILAPLLKALGLGGGAAGGGGFLSGLGFSKGGLIDPFGEAQGLAHGGRPKRPKGLHHTDRIPIWAAAGEFMMRVAAVRRYGKAFMEAINEGRINPNLARALAGVRGNEPDNVRVQRATPGFQAGGTITPRSSSSTLESARSRATGEDFSVLPVLPLNEQTMSRFLAAGNNSLRRWIGNNPDVIRAAIGAQRR